MQAFTFLSSEMAQLCFICTSGRSSLRRFLLLLSASSHSGSSYFSSFRPLIANNSVVFVVVHFILFIHQMVHYFAKGAASRLLDEILLEHAMHLVKLVQCVIPVVLVVVILLLGLTRVQQSTNGRDKLLLSTVIVHEPASFHQKFAQIVPLQVLVMHIVLEMLLLLVMVVIVMLESLMAVTVGDLLDPLDRILLFSLQALVNLLEHLILNLIIKAVLARGLTNGSWRQIQVNLVDDLR